MGKAARWFRGLLGGKKTESTAPTKSRSEAKPAKEKRRWSFVRSFREKENHNSTRTASNDRRGSCEDAVAPSAYVDDVDPNKHAIAVAAATAAVAEAAVAAAQAAAAVVRLTSSGRSNPSAAYVSAKCGTSEECAAVKIQASFRGYLVSFLILFFCLVSYSPNTGHEVRRNYGNTLPELMIRIWLRYWGR